MLDRPTNPLEIARSVLRQETINEVRRSGFTNSAYLILDRWALNQPDDLRQLEAIHILDFLVTLDMQCNREANVLNSDSAWEARQQGMNDWEILEMHGVDTSLKVTA